MAEIYTKLKFTIPKEKEYSLMKYIAKETFDFPGYWPVEEYDDDARTITTEDDILKTNDDAVELIKELDSQLKKVADDADEEWIRKFIFSICFSVDGETEFINSGERIAFRIERNEKGKITYKENYISFGDDEFYPDDEGEFGPAEDINDHIAAGKPFSIGPKEVEEYFKAHGLEFSMEKYEALTMDDIFNIMNGTYNPGKNKGRKNSKTSAKGAGSRDSKPKKNAEDLEKKYNSAIALLDKGDLESFDKGIKQLQKLGDYKDAKQYIEQGVSKRAALVEIEKKAHQQEEARWQQKRKDALIARGLASCTDWVGYLAYVKQDGTVTVDASRVHLYGKEDSSVVVEGVKRWEDIKAVAAVSKGGVVGLKWDGTCVYAVTGGLEKEYVLSDVANWKDIVYLDSNNCFCVGVDKNGNCHTTHYHINSNTANDNDKSLKVATWSNVESITCGDFDSACCVRKDGTVKTTGYYVEKSIGNAKLAALGAYSFVWYDADGKYHQEKVSEYVETLTIRERIEKPVDIKINEGNIIILYEDNVMRFGSSTTQNVIGINLSNSGAVYITADGYAHYRGKEYKLFDDFDCFRDHDKMIAFKKQKEAEEKEREEKQRAEYKAQGVCQHCGGAFKKTLFGIKCVNCGTKKDY